MKNILLGYEVETGDAIEIPSRHLAVTGQTQQSGKTTTLEALAERSGATVVTFITKRGEKSFAEGRRIAPYFRDRADWQFVTSILDATLQEKNKFLRPWIMKICRNTKTLAEVQRQVRAALETAKGINEGVYTQLDAYLDLIVPEISRAKLARSLDIQPGINVMDVSSFATPMQMLFIQSALDWVNDECQNTIVVIPEAWEFVPEGKGSPVKASAITLVRKGAALGNFIWVDSQDMAGVDKTILRGCTVWLLGVQREANEIKRNIANIPAGISRPNASDVALLDRGQFYACFGRTIAKVYVRPSWMPEAEAVAIAKGGDQHSTPPIPKAAPKEAEVTEAEARELRDENEALKRRIEEQKESAATAWDDGARHGEREGYKTALVAAAAAIKALPLSGTATVAPLQPLPIAAPAAIKPAAISQSPSEVTLAGIGLLQVLAQVHPNKISSQVWGAFAGKSASGGHWNGQVKTLRDNGLVAMADGLYAATKEGLSASPLKPAKLKDDADMFRFFRDIVRAQIEPTALSILSTLVLHHPHRLTPEQWGLLADRKPSGGHWNGAVKDLRDWELVTVEGGRYAVTDRGFALIETKPSQSKATEQDLKRARRAGMGQAAQRLFDNLFPPMTRTELAAAVGMKPTGGHWNGAVKTLLDSGLVVDADGALRFAKEELAA